MNRYPFVVLVVILLVSPSVVFAVDPLHRDSAFTLKDSIMAFSLFSLEEKAKVVPATVEFILTYDKLSNGSQLSPEVDLTATVLKDLDVTLAVPYLFTRENASNGVDKNNGLADTEIDAKFKFFNRNNYAIALISALVLPTGSKSKGLGDGSASAIVGGIVSKRISGLIINAQLGFQMTGKDFRDFMIYSIGGAYQFTPRWDVFAQAKGHTSSTKGSDSNIIVAKFGFDYSFTKFWQLTVLVARRLTTLGPDYRTSLDIAHNF